MAEDSTISECQRAVTMARALVHAAKAKTASPEFLLAGVLHVLGPQRSSSILHSVGFDATDRLFASLPKPPYASTDTKEPVRPSPELEKLMRSKLADFLSGKAAPEEAVRILLTDPACADRMKRFLASPANVLAPVPVVATVESTRDLLRSLARFYQRRWHLGHMYHGIDRSRGASDFAEGARDEEFLRAVDELDKEQKPLAARLFRSRLYQDSLLGRCWREMGEVHAHAMGMVLLGEMDQVGDGLVNIQEIAYTLSPKYFHRYLSFVRTAVAQLHQQRMVHTVGGDPVEHLAQSIVPTAAVLEQFLTYLRDADPIAPEEQQDLLKEMD